MRGLAFAGYPRTLRHKSLILERLLDIDKTTTTSKRSFIVSIKSRFVKDLGGKL